MSYYIIIDNNLPAARNEALELSAYINSIGGQSFEAKLLNDTGASMKKQVKRAAADDDAILLIFIGKREIDNNTYTIRIVNTKAEWYVTKDYFYTIGPHQHWQIMLMAVTIAIATNGWERMTLPELALKGLVPLQFWGPVNIDLDYKTLQKDAAGGG